MNLTEQYLQKFGLTSFCSHEDIKKAYRKLAISTHPDHGGTDQAFIELNEQYQYLLANHKPKLDPTQFQHLFRIFEMDFEKMFKQKQDIVQVVDVPETILTKDTSVHIMIYGLPEFNVVLKKGTTLPLTINVEDKRLLQYAKSIVIRFRSTEKKK